MPIPTKYVYVTTNYMGYLSAIKQFGPIVHPAKITEDEANALLLAGVDLVRHDPATKMTYHMSLTKKVEDHIDKIPEPIQETVLTGTPKFSTLILLFVVISFSKTNSKSKLVLVISLNTSEIV